MRDDLSSKKYSCVDAEKLAEQERQGAEVVEKMILEARFETRPDRAVDQRVVSDIVSNSQQVYNVIPDNASTYSEKAARRKNSQQYGP